MLQISFRNWTTRKEWSPRAWKNKGKEERVPPDREASLQLRNHPRAIPGVDLGVQGLELDRQVARRNREVKHQALLRKSWICLKIARKTVRISKSARRIARSNQKLRMKSNIPFIYFLLPLGTNLIIYKIFSNRYGKSHKFLRQ